MMSDLPVSLGRRRRPVSPVARVLHDPSVIPAKSQYQLRECINQSVSQFKVFDCHQLGAFNRVVGS